MGWEDVASFLGSCQSPDGGFGGGPQQLPHLAPTYAAVAALTDLGQPAALAVIDRRGVAAFIQRMAVPSERGGGFRVCDGAPNARMPELVVCEGLGVVLSDRATWCAHFGECMRP